LRDQCGNEVVPISGFEAENENAFISSKTGNEGIQRFLIKTVHQAGPILLFAEKCFGTSEADERNQTGILTWGFKPRSRLPDPARRSVALGSRSPLQWRNRPGFSPGSLTFDCYSGRHLPADFKERSFCTLKRNFAKRKISKTSLLLKLAFRAHPIHPETAIFARMG
jgi:hypothetical protein